MKELSVLLALLLSGCATGVQMSEAEAAACRRDGCTAWTASELGQLATKIFNEGFTRGAKSAGRAL